MCSPYHGALKSQKWGVCPLGWSSQAFFNTLLAVVDHGLLWYNLPMRRV